MRIRRSDVERVAEIARVAALEVGFDAPPVDVEPGGEAAGVAWAVTEKGTGQVPEWLNGVPLGMTATTAERALLTVTQTLFNVMRVQR